MIAMPTARRETDAQRSAPERVRDLALWLARRQNQFSLFSAALSAVLALTLLVDFVVGHEHIERWYVAMWIGSYVVMTLLPIVFGRSYPRWAGMLFIAYLTFWSAYNLLNGNHPHMELNALLEIPMVAVYLGWFYEGWVARAGLLLHLAVLSAVVMIRPVGPDHEFSSELALVYAVIIAVFCLEAASYVRRVMEREAHHDQLTGALNRRGLSRFSAQLFRRAERSGEPVVVVAVDFDDFKSVNDQGGHAEGDRALRAATLAWSEGLGEQDLVARIGGDEFILVIHADEAEAEARLERLLAAAEHPWSWGVTRVAPGDTLYQLMLRADEALYAQKGMDGDPPRRPDA